MSRFYLKKTLKYLTIFIVILSLFSLFAFFLFDKLNPLDKSLFIKEQSRVVFDSQKRAIRYIKSKDGYFRFNIKLKEIPELLINSVLLFEDKYFYQHFGVNPISLLRATIFNIFNSNKIGASTITMQVARIIKPKNRSFKNKLFEIFRSFQIERNFSKDEILELYLNLAPYGGNLEGIKSASIFYFDEELKNLTISQMSLLTLIPKNPNRNRLDRIKNIYKKRKRVLDALFKNALIESDSYKRALNEPLERKRYRTLYKHKHFTNLFLDSKELEIDTFLDSPLQSYIEKLLYEKIQKLRENRVNHASAIVIDNRDMKVIAYVGSQDFKAHLGENDGVRAKREVGSTLKPFIYALAFDSGFITKYKKVLDIALNINGYEPKNFDKLFRGAISTAEALRLSLNIPAIDLNLRLKDNSIYEFLDSFGFVQNSKEHFGQSIVLGSSSLSLLELTYLYTIFPNEGEIKPLKLTPNREFFRFNRELFSKEASFLITDILKDNYQKELSSYFDSAKDYKIAFKSGTSSNLKDLWIVGYTQEFTVGLWFGNFDSSKTIHTSGINTASPALFDIFNYLSKYNKLTLPKKPKNLIKKRICLDAISSFDEKNCRESLNDFLIAGVRYREDCSLLGDKISFLSENSDFNISKIKNCFSDIKLKKPDILYPIDSATFYRSELLPEELQQIEFKCLSYDRDRLFLYIDTIFKREILSNKSYFLDLEKGKHSLGCLDMNSNYREIEIEIR